LSTSEGFPNALGEAMASGCVPIGSAVGAIPEIIGDTGIVLTKKNISILENQLQKLISQPIPHSSACKRIKTHFSFTNRKTKLINCLGM